MKFGYKLPNCAGVLCEPEWATPDNLKRLSHLAHRLGYDSLWLHDHLLTPTEVQVAEPNFYESLITISHLASEVPEVQFGVATIILPLRDPVLLARQISTLQAFIPGRLIVGVGVGRYESEFVASGSSWFRKRGSVTTESLRLIRALWDNDVTDFDGKFRSLHGARLYPKPTSQGGVPIWVGGNSPAAIRRAARFGDGYVPAAKLPDEIRADKELLIQEMEKAGRDPTGFAIGLSLTIELMNSNDIPTDDLEGRGMHGHASNRIVQGQPSEVAAQLNNLAAAGVNHFLISYRATSLSELIEKIEWFAQDVRPLCDNG